MLSSLVLSSSSLSLQGEAAAPVVRRGQPSLHPARGSRRDPSQAEKEHPGASRSAAPEQPARGSSEVSPGRGRAGEAGDLETSAFPALFLGAAHLGWRLGGRRQLGHSGLCALLICQRGTCCATYPPAPRPGR